MAAQDPRLATPTLTLLAAWPFPAGWDRGGAGYTTEPMSGHSPRLASKILENLLDLAGRPGWAENIALHFRATFGTKDIELLGGFDPLRRCYHPKARTE